MSSPAPHAEELTRAETQRIAARLLGRGLSIEAASAYLTCLARRAPISPEAAATAVQIRFELDGQEGARRALDALHDLLGIPRETFTDTD